MDEREKRVREAARAHFKAQMRVEGLRMMNTPTDRDERMALYEALVMAEAEASRTYYEMLSAKRNYAN